MTVALIFVIFAALALTVFLWTLRSSRAGERERADSNLELVDPEAFLNLMDPAEEAFLRAHLAPAEFRKVQKERLRAALDYVSGISRQAAALLEVGAAARRSASPEVAEAGQRLTDSASQVRAYALMAQIKLRAAIVFPGASLDTARIVEGYRRITDNAGRLGQILSKESGTAVNARG